MHFSLRLLTKFSLLPRLTVITPSETSISAAAAAAIASTGVQQTNVLVKSEAIISSAQTDTSDYKQQEETSIGAGSTMVSTFSSTSSIPEESLIIDAAEEEELRMLREQSMKIAPRSVALHSFNNIFLITTVLELLSYFGCRANLFCFSSLIIILNCFFSSSF